MYVGAARGYYKSILRMFYEGRHVILAGERSPWALKYLPLYNINNTYVDNNINSTVYTVNSNNISINNNNDINSENYVHPYVVNINVDGIRRAPDAQMYNDLKTLRKEDI